MLTQRCFTYENDVENLHLVTIVSLQGETFNRLLLSSEKVVNQDLVLRFFIDVFIDNICMVFLNKWDE